MAKTSKQEGKEIKPRVDGRIFKEIGERLYSQNWEMVAVRGFVQNALDAKAESIEIEIEENKLVMRNIGSPMKKEILESSFINFGGTTKNLKNGKTIGGFGIEVAGILSAESWKVVSGNTRLSFDGQVIRSHKNGHYDGTEIEILRSTPINFDEIYSLLASCDIKIPLHINKSSVRAEYSLKGKRAIKTFKWGKVYRFQDNEDTLVVRYKGLTMFTRDIYSDGSSLVIELSGNGILTGTREALPHEYQRQLDRFIATLQKDTRSSYRQEASPELLFSSCRMANKTFEFSDKRYSGTSRYPNVDENPKARKLAVLWHEIVNKIQSNTKTGFIYQEGVVAQNNNGTIRLNPRGFNLEKGAALVLKLLPTACHELAHNKASYHDETFMGIYDSLLEKELIAFAKGKYSQLVKLAEKGMQEF